MLDRIYIALSSRRTASPSHRVGPSIPPNQLDWIM
uniref:Uncharacterized protein n=1 Tax=Knipowitschia caucasica TaxID=637954 RepID=A0AAV2K8K6_KNICA